MSTPMNAECYLCHLKRSIDTAWALAGEEAADKVAKDMMQVYATAPDYASSPWFEPAVTALLEKHCGLKGDRFRQEKEASNRFILERLDTVRQRIAQGDDPVYAALQMAVLGNYIDFSALRGEVSFETLETMLEEAVHWELDSENYAALRQQLETAKTLLYITDNCGEIGLDRLCAETLREHYPNLEITFCVRGGAVSNDATRADAMAVGIDFPIIDNGIAMAGMHPECIGETAARAMETADVILSKGQANVETLLGCGKNIYYLFLVKCKRFQTLFQKPKLTPMLVRERKGT